MKFQLIELGFLLFMTYSFLGWLLEVIVCYKDQKKFINRGFLIGPFCPIYGVGSLLMIILLHDYVKDIIVLFCLSVIVCSILEYVTSYIMEKLFRARWWDYSDKRFNINGRVCLETLVPFGFFGTLIVAYINPFLFSLYSDIPKIAVHFVTGFFLGLFLLDLVVSCNIIMSFKKVARTIKKDSTEEITKRVRKVLTQQSVLTSRLMRAFPNAQATIGKLSKKHYLFKFDRDRHEKKRK